MIGLQGHTCFASENHWTGSSFWLFFNCVTKQISHLETGDFLTFLFSAFIIFMYFYLHYTFETIHHYLNLKR